MEETEKIELGARAKIQVGKNLVDVRVIGRTEHGWRVFTSAGKEMMVKCLNLAEEKVPTVPMKHSDCNESRPARRSLLNVAEEILRKVNAPMTAPQRPSLLFHERWRNKASGAASCLLRPSTTFRLAQFQQ